MNTALGTNSSTTAPAIQMNVGSNWTFDFSNLAAVTFTGNIQYGTYATQTWVTGLGIDGRYTVNNALQTFNNTALGGTTTWNAGTNTLTYTKAIGASNAGGASTGTNTGGICKNGGTFLGQNACSSATAASPAWEGLTFSFVFSADKSTFTGALTGTDKSGSGTTANTTTINWQVSGNAPPPAPTVPVPAAAWLFGSGLLGLAGTARRRRSV
ncbi:MAG TPA: VPLPA-CTERM sorting domain-containing protein [Spongiibacteraceae bacterium]|nr:VPLPA-CTERM sorting domain-containing protein [Spongiibacteraceae bacterium]